MIIWTCDAVMAADFHSAGASVHVRKIEGQPARFEIIWEEEHRNSGQIQVMGLRARQQHRQKVYWKKVLEELLEKDSHEA